MSASQSRRTTVLAVLLAASVGWAAQQPEVPAEDLAIDATPTKDIRGGEVHAYRVALGPGRFLHLAARQRGIDLVIRTSDPDGRVLAETDFRATADGNEWVSLVSGPGGAYRFELRPRFPDAAPGSYALKLTSREATARDRALVDAERAFEQGDRLRREGTQASLTQALVKMEEARRIVGASGDKLLEARIIGDSGVVLRSLGRITEAIERYGLSLPLRREAGDRRGEAMMLNNIAVGYRTLGEPRRAIEQFEQALGLWRLMGDRQGEAMTTSNLGTCFLDLGDFPAALQRLNQALSLARTAKAPVEEARVESKLGETWVTLGELDRAREHFEAAADRYRSVGHRGSLAAALQLLAGVLSRRGQQAEALARLDEAVNLARALSNRGLEGMAISARGVVRGRRGERLEKTMDVERAVSLLRGTGSQDEAWALYNLASARMGEGRLREARSLLDEGLGLFQRYRNRRGAAYTRHALALLRRDEGDLDGALAEVAVAIADGESMRGSAPNPDLGSTLVAFLPPSYNLQTDLLIRKYERDPAMGLAAEALAVVERHRARGLVELLAEGRLDPRQDLDPALRAREQDAQARISSLQSRIVEARLKSPPDTEAALALETELKAADTEREAVEREIRRASPRYAELRYPDAIALPGIQALLDAETALLAYELGPEGSFVFVVTRDALAVHRLTDPKELPDLVGVVHGQLRTPARLGMAGYVRAARRLYAVLVAPTEPILASKRRLLIAADGVLHRLPFEALVTSDTAVSTAGAGSPAYLLRRWSVGYVPSATALAALRGRRPASPSVARELVAFADPARTGPPVSEGATDAVRSLLEGAGIESVGPLPAAEAEARAIAGLFPAATVELYVKGDAREETVKTGAGIAGARRVHFATHALVSAVRPERSALLLSLDDDHREDGLLQAWEIYNLRLSADLVVLSACETGSGRNVAGEGVMSLTRAFLHAGAASVVASLWPVADRSTSDLMVSFYRHLDRAPDKVEALRRAKLELIAGGFDHPHHWAPFILVGDPGTPAPALR